MRCLLAGLLLLAPLGLDDRAEAGCDCCAPPDDWTPHLSLLPGPTWLEPDRPFEAGVYLVLNPCSDLIDPDPADLRVEIVGGGELTPTQRAGRIRVTPPAGTHTIRFTSRTHPTLHAEVSVRVMANAQPVRLELDRRRGGVFLTDGAGHRTRPARVRGNIARVRVGDTPAFVRWERRGAPSRHAPIVFDGRPRIPVRFLGSELRIDLDGLPRDGRMFEARLVRDGRVGSRAPLSDSGAVLDHDVWPGEVAIRVVATERVDPWDANADHAWRTLAEIPVIVAPESELVLRWSGPRLVAGESPNRGTWTDLPGPMETRRARPRNGIVDLALPAPAALRDGTLIVGGSHTFEYRSDWREVEALASAAVDVLGPQRWVAVLGDRAVFRTPRGLASEALPVYDGNRPYPCAASAVAIVDEVEVVVVGQCRGNSPEWQNVPEEGFVVVRSAAGWTRVPLDRDSPPLLDVAVDGERIVVVGENGVVLERNDGRWRRWRMGRVAIEGVAAHGGRTVFRTAEGELKDASGQRIGRVDDRAAGQHCLTNDGLAVWYRPILPTYEGGPGSEGAPAFVRHWWRNGRSQTIGEREPRGVACDRDQVRVLVAGDDGLELAN